MNAKKPYGRRERVGPLIHRHLNGFLAKGMVDLPMSSTQMTVASVDVSPDFAQAKVYFSVLEEDMAESLALRLNQDAHIFQKHLASQLTLRRMPKLKFVFDDTQLAGSRIGQLLSDVCA